MSSVGRIGSTGGVSRDTPSGGHDVVDRKFSQELAELGGNSARADAKPARNQKVDEVAKMYEKQFLREMVKAMRGTVSFSDTTKPNMAENIYREQLDNEYVESWGENGGIGLSDVIYEQLMDRYFDGGAKSLKQQGGIQLSDRDVLKVSRMRNESLESPVSKQVPLKVELKQSADGTAAQVKAPWDGDVVAKTRLDGRTAVTLDHGPGVRSTLIFDGVPGADVQPGARIEKGRTVGVLSPEINSFFWNLNRTSSSVKDEGQR